MLENIVIQNKKKSKWKKVILIAAAVFAALFVGMAVYINDDYPANEAALRALAGDEEITVECLEDGTLLFTPEQPTAALVFYQGGKVDHQAYAPLMCAYAREGILCILPKMPLQIAVLDSNAAARYRDNYPEIDTWYIGGHSLGGAMAASHVKEHQEEYEGLILLGSYSMVDLSETDLQVLSIYGSEDRVLNYENYEEYRAYLPNDFSEVVLEGGCHAYFGSYGAQDGDGTPSITNDAQIEETVQITVDIFAKSLW